MRRAEKEITDRERLHQILDELSVCRMAFNDEAAPYLVPVNFVRLDDRLYFHAAQEGRKMDLLARDPRVGFEVDRLLSVKEGDIACGWGACYESVTGTGEAVIVQSPEEKKRALRGLMAKYSGRGDWEFSPEALNRVAVVCVNIHSVTGKRST